MIERIPRPAKTPEVFEGPATELQGEEFAGRKFIGLTVNAPEGPQARERKENPEKFSEMELLGDIADSEDALIDSVASVRFNRASGEIQDVQVEVPAHPAGSTWYLDERTPKPIRHIFEQALAYEASINPELADYRYKAHISIRLIKPEHASYWANPDEGVAQPHFDGNRNFREPSASIYIVSSAPGTIEYAPESSSVTIASEIGTERFSTSAKEWFEREGANQGMRATSILPMKLYHYDERTLHSTPWKNFPAKASSKPRFLCRIMFYQPD